MEKKIIQCIEIRIIIWNKGLSDVLRVLGVLHDSVVKSSSRNPGVLVPINTGSSGSFV